MPDLKKLSYILYGLINDNKWIGPKLYERKDNPYEHTYGEIKHYGDALLTLEKQGLITINKEINV